MTDSARQRNIADSLARADQALAVADAALVVGGSADAISRAYYARLHYLRALLFSRGLDPRTHADAQHLFNQEFVKAGLFPARTNRLLASLQRQRALADYDSAIVFDPADVRQQIAEVRGFGADVRALLQKEGWLGA